MTDAIKIESLSANRESLTGRMPAGQRPAEIGAGGLSVLGSGSEAGAAAEEFGSKSVGTAI